MTKAAVFKEKGLLEIEDIPQPNIGPEEVLIKITHCAICGSDIHRYAYGMLRPGAVMGHEYAGEIVDKGKDVQGFKIGDRVARWDEKTNPVNSFVCPVRYNAREMGLSPKLKKRAYAEYMAINADGIIKVPDSLTNLEVCMLEPLAVAIHSIRLSGMQLGDKVLILGAGPIGLFTQQCAFLAGASKVYTSEINHTRKELASTLGASEVLDPTEVGLVEEIVKRTQIGVDVAFECAGAYQTLQNALEAVKISGKVILSSLAWDPVHCLPVEWVGREVGLKATYGTSGSDWPIAMWLLENKKIQVKPIISRIIPLDDIQQTFQELMKPEKNSFVQVVVGFE